MYNGKSAYPRYFKTPEGRAVSIRKMGAALRVIRDNPGAEYPGWNWFPTPGYYILHAFRDGMHDRINKRALIPTPAPRLAP